MRKKLPGMSEQVDQAVEKGQFDTAKELIGRALRLAVDAEATATLRNMLEV